MKLFKELVRSSRRHFNAYTGQLCYLSSQVLSVPVEPVFTLTDKEAVPESITKPNYVNSLFNKKNSHDSFITATDSQIKSDETIGRIREACRLGRRILNHLALIAKRCEELERKSKHDDNVIDQLKTKNSNRLKIITLLNEQIHIYKNANEFVLQHSCVKENEFNESRSLDKQQIDNLQKSLKEVQQNVVDLNIDKENLQIEVSKIKKLVQQKNEDIEKSNITITNLQGRVISLNKMIGENQKQSMYYNSVIDEQNIIFESLTSKLQVLQSEAKSKVFKMFQRKKSVNSIVNEVIDILKGHLNNNNFKTDV